MEATMFVGREGWSALGLDPSGAGLPQEHGPWTPTGTVRASEAEELADLRAQGFHLSRRKENDDS